MILLAGLVPSAFTFESLIIGLLSSRDLISIVIIGVQLIDFSCFPGRIYRPTHSDRFNSLSCKSYNVIFRPTLNSYDMT